jgi:hypothetical protein
MNRYSKAHPLRWAQNEWHRRSQRKLDFSSNTSSIDEFESVPDIHDADTVFECVQESNEAIFVPSFYGHATLNEQESVGIALEIDNKFC